MRANLLRLLGLLAAATLALPAAAQNPVTVKLGYLSDPSHEAVLWAVRKGKVTSDKVRIETTALDISALIQATAARTYDVIQTAVVAIPRARERGLDLRIIGTALRYHPSGEGAGIWVKKGSPIRSVADLKGKKLAVYSVGSAGITLVRIALADVHGLNVALKGGDIELVEMPAAAMPAALAVGNVDAATLIHAQAFKAQQTGEFVAIEQTASALTQKFGARMVSAVLAGYGEKLDAAPETYVETLRVLKASVDYALKNRAEVFAAVAAETKTEVAFFEAWFSRFSEFPVTMAKADVTAIDRLWKRSVDLGLLKVLPPMKEAIWSKAPME